MLGREPLGRCGRTLEAGLGGGAETEQAKEHEEIHDTPLQQFHLMKKLFPCPEKDNPPPRSAGAAMRAAHEIVQPRA